MSNYIATAQVKVEPSTVGFEKTLREKLKPILAKPFAVKVVPVTTGFATALRTSLKNLKAVSVPVVPTKLEAFRAAIAAQSIPVEVPVYIDPTALRTQLTAAVAAAEAGVVATIPVAFVGGGGPGDVGALNAALTSLTTQMEKLAKAQTAATKTGETRRKTEKALSVEEDLRDKINKRLLASETALTDAMATTISLEEQEALVSTSATKAKSAYAFATDLAAESSTAENLALKEKARVQQQEVLAAKGRVEQARKNATVSKANANLEARANALISESIKARSSSAKSITSETAAKERANAMSRIASKLRTAESAAIKAQLPLLAEAIALERASATAYVQAARDQGRTITRQIKDQERLRATQIAQGKTAAGQLNFARRGAAATALSLLGIRGATLASTGAFLAGAAAASIFAISVKSAVDLEQELNVFQVTAGATADEMERVRVTAEELGRDIRLPGISAADAAVAMTSLAKAGLSVQDSIAGAAGVLQLSIAANIDLARSTEIVASSLNAFGLAGREAVNVADILANSANLAQGSIDDMGIAMQQAAAVGRQAGLSFADTATFLTILARAGLRGSDAGTSLRTGLIRLINPTEKAQAILDKLGVSIRDASGNVRPEVFQNLAAATANMSKAQRDQTIAQLAGNDAVRAFSIIMRLTTPELIKFRQENRKAGTAAALTEARAKGLAGAARGLASNLQTTGISIGRYATPALHGMVSGMNDLVLAMSSSAQVRDTFKAFFQALGDVWRATISVGQTLAPVLLTVGKAASQAVVGIGVTSILAGVAAWKLMVPALVGAAGAFNALRVAAYGTFLIFETFRVSGLGRTGAAVMTFRRLLAGAVTSMTGWTIALTAATVGITYLLTRETALEKSQKSLKQATDALAQSMGAYKTAAQATADAISAISTEELALQTANLNEELARTALQNSTAGKSSLERRQLENALAVAIDNVRIAQQRLGTAQQQALTASAEEEVALNNRRRARAKELEEIQKFIDLRSRQIAMLAPRGGLNNPEVRNLALSRAINTELTKRINLLEEENTVASRDLANRLRIVRTLQTQLGRGLTETEIRILLNADDVKQGLGELAPLLGQEGGKAADAWVRGLLLTLPGHRPKIGAAVKSVMADAGTRAAYAAGQAIGTNLGTAMRDALNNTKQSIVDMFRGILGALKAEAESFAAQEDLLTIAMGGRVTPTARLAFLRKQQANLEKTLKTIGILAKKEGWTDALKEQRDIANDQLAAILTEIAQIEDQMAADAESAKKDSEAKAEKIASDLAEAGQAFVDKLTLKQQPFLRRQERASQTERLSDDIRANKALQRLYKIQIAKIRENVKDKETRNAAIRDLQQKSFQLDLDLNALLKQQADRQQALIRERFELDIQFFQTTENRRGEINARKRFIAYLKRLQKEARGDKLEVMRLRNEIADQEKALDDLKKQTKERNNAWAELTFTFLQAQQGFAANLLGNLIPLGASQGLVGNISTTGGGGGIAGSAGTPGTPIPGLVGSAAAGFGGGLGAALINQPDRRLLQAQGRAAGATQPPMGRDQGSVEIQLLQTIAAILARMERGSRHPEARRSQVSQRNDYETINHGPGSD